MRSSPTEQVSLCQRTNWQGPWCCAQVLHGLLRSSWWRSLKFTNIWSLWQKWTRKTHSQWNDALNSRWFQGSVGTGAERKARRTKTSEDAGCHLHGTSVNRRNKTNRVRVKNAQNWQNAQQIRWMNTTRKRDRNDKVLQNNSQLPEPATDDATITYHTDWTTNHPFLKARMHRWRNSNAIRPSQQHAPAESVQSAAVVRLLQRQRKSHSVLWVIAIGGLSMQRKPSHVSRSHPPTHTHTHTHSHTHTHTHTHTHFLSIFLSLSLTSQRVAAARLSTWLTDAVWDVAPPDAAHGARAVAQARPLRTRDHLEEPLPELLSADDVQQEVSCKNREPRFHCWWGRRPQRFGWKRRTWCLIPFLEKEVSWGSKAQSR